MAFDLAAKLSFNDAEGLIRSKSGEFVIWSQIGREPRGWSSDLMYRANGRATWVRDP